MSDSSQSISKGARIVGWTMSILPALVLFFSASMKLMQAPDFIKGVVELGWTAEQMFKLAFVEVTCTILYLIPRTSVLGAILLTAYMGGAVAAHLRVGQPFIVQVLVGVFAWGGLYFRDLRIRRLLPLS